MQEIISKDKMDNNYGGMVWYGRMGDEERSGHLPEINDRNNASIEV